MICFYRMVVSVVFYCTSQVYVLPLAMSLNCILYGDVYKGTPHFSPITFYCPTSRVINFCCCKKALHVLCFCCTLFGYLVILSLTLCSSS